MFGQNYDQDCEINFQPLIELLLFMVEVELDFLLLRQRSCVSLYGIDFIFLFLKAYVWGVLSSVQTSFYWSLSSRVNLLRPQAPCSCSLVKSAAMFFAILVNAHSLSNCICYNPKVLHHPSMYLAQCIYALGCSVFVILLNAHSLSNCICYDPEVPHCLSMALVQCI